MPSNSVYVTSHGENAAELHFYILANGFLLLIFLLTLFNSQNFQFFYHYIFWDVTECNFGVFMISG